MKIRIVCLAICCIAAFSTTVFAQTEEEERTGQFGDDLRFPALPFYSYGSGLGLTTPDSTFRLNIRFRMQNRVSYINHDDGDDAIEGVVRRMRLRFDGFVGDPRFLYAIQLSFAPGDVGELSEGDNINIIRDAVMFYQPNRNWSIGFGQTKLPGNRQRVNSSGALQLTDRSINNARFTIDRDFGTLIYYLNEDENRTSYNIKTAISTGDGRNWTRNPDTNLAYTGRVEFFPFGVFKNNGMLFEGDLAREQTPKLLLAGTYHLNQGVQRTRGQLGDELFETRDLTSIHLDAMLKYNGWAFQTAYLTRSADEPITVNPSNEAEQRFIFAGRGADFQLSYLFPSNYELIGRYSTQTPSSSIKDLAPSIEQYSLGLTKYIWEHSLKLQAELTSTVEEWSIRDDRKNWYLRFQIEIGI
ncbi:MAG: hypothetical protein JJU37_13935 [Balneolaceae bacterium]|nr:hypothetical protein [Balneolaceae bacterium]